MLKRKVILGQIITFYAVGAASYALNVVVLAYCVELLGMHYIGAMMVSFLIVISTAHFLNRVLTFRSRANYFRELGKYNVVTLGQFALGLGLMAILIELGHLQYLIANALAAIVLAAASFFVHKKWTFGRKASDHE